MLKKIAFAMFANGVLLASMNVAAETSIAPGSNVPGYETRTLDRVDSPFPDQSKSIDYGRIAISDIDNPYPDQSKSNDYGIRTAKADGESVFPDQSKSNDYGIRVAA